MVKYSDEIAALICERMAGGQSLGQICRAKDMPARQNVLQWLRKNEQFRAQYVQAREDLVEYWADEILDVSYDTADDTHITTYGDGTERTSPNTEWISRSRLKVDSLKWLMSKLAPKKYGDHLQVDQKTTHALDDSVGALFERIGSQGKRIHDK